MGAQASKIVFTFSVAIVVIRILSKKYGRGRLRFLQSSSKLRKAVILSVSILLWFDLNLCFSIFVSKVWSIVC